MMSEAAKVFVQSIAFILILAVAGIWWNWGWITTRSIYSDLNYYSQSVRRSMLDLEEKTKLLDEIDLLRDNSQDGETTSKSRWDECDAAVREMCGHGITADEAVLIVRELRRMKKDMNQ
jgi:hypothetical protein